MALCADAEVKDGGLVGDPTEGALVVLAAKGGVDPTLTREQYPRVATLPFDAAYKFMATFHRMTDANGKAVIRCFVKGAPDQLLARARAAVGPDGKSYPIDRRPRAVPRRERAARRPGPAGHGDGPTRLRPRHVRLRAPTCCRSSPTSTSWRSSASSTRRGPRRATRSPTPIRPASRSA